MTDIPIRDAATVILVRDRQTTPRVLMGQRGKSAVFMPNKYVFPGGAVDGDDARLALRFDLPAPCRARLGADATRLANAAIRELWEETGLRLGRAGQAEHAIPSQWAEFVDDGVLPDATHMRFVFRAVTPPHQTRRFDARFFMADATAIMDDLDNFSRASDELSHLQWVSLPQARSLDLPFITEVVLAEIEALIERFEPPVSVPFFDNRGDTAQFRRIS